MKVKFLPQGEEFEIQPDQSVMKLAHQKGLKIKSVCNGLPSCAECRIKIVEGEHNVLPPSAKELSLIGTGHFIDQRRLSCQLICFGDITVDLTEQMDKVIHEQQRRPQGSLKKDDSEVSHAVTGNLIDLEAPLLEEVDVARDRGGRRREGAPDRDGRKSGGYRENRRDHRQGAKASSKKGKDNNRPSKRYKERPKG